MPVATVKNSLRQLRSDVRKARSTLSLVFSLPAFLREPINLQTVEFDVKAELENREERFLHLIYTGVYQSTASPYLKLLKLAGCEYGDLQSHVWRHGLEKTLQQLASEGVYLTSDEFKGKKDIVRGKDQFRAAPEAFERRDAGAGFVAQSSGTRNRPIRSSIALDWLRIRSLGIGLFLKSHNVCSHAHAVYEPILPVSTGINNILYNARLRIPTERWFAARVPANNPMEAWYNSSVTSLVVRTAKLLGHNFPNPEIGDQGHIEEILRWIEDKRTEGKDCCIKTTASNAAKIANQASKTGVSLERTKFISGGEPFTEAKQEVIKRAGASAITRYNYGGGVTVGLGCANPIHTDEVHVNQYMLAVISQPKALILQDRVVRPLLCTTLYSSAPRLLLNVDNGDYADLLNRDCGCRLQRAGLTLHLHHIRSYEKFTSEGMNYFYGDLFDFIEGTLPSEFGGGPGDYQLIEEEDSGGQSRLTLVIHPSVGDLDERRVLVRLRNAFSKGSRDNRFMTGIWESAGTFRIKRAIPHSSNRGKVLPLHISMVNNRSGRG